MKISRALQDKNSGKWRVELNNKGKRVKRFFSGRNQAREVAKAMDQALIKGRFEIDFPKEARQLGLVEAGKGGIRWEEAARVYLEQYGSPEVRNARVTTVITAKGHLDRCRKDLGNPQMGNVKREEIEGFINRRGKTQKSRDSIRGAVVAFLNWCGKKGYCERGRFLRLEYEKIMQDKGRPDFWTDEQIELFFDFSVIRKAGSNQSGAKIDPKKSRKFRAALGCAILLGIRPGSYVKGIPRHGELPLLRRSDFDLDRKVLEIRAEISKTRSPRTVMDLPENLIAAVEGAKYRKDEFIMPLSYERWRVHLREIRKRIRKETGIALPWCQKLFRHCFGTHAYWRGLEWVIEAGGWQDPRLLTKHYRSAGNKEMSERVYSMDIATLPTLDMAEKWKGRDL